MVLLKGGAEAVASRATVQAEGVGDIGHGVPVEEDQYRRLDEVVEDLVDDGFHGRSGEEFEPLA